MKDFKLLIKCGLLVLIILLVGAAVGLLVKTDTGLAPWDAMTLTLNFITGMKMGTIGMICQLALIVVQIILKGRKFKKINLLQIPMVILLGSTVNFFVYTVFKDLSFGSYAVRLIVTVLSHITLAFLIGGMVSLGLIVFPTEGFASAFHEKTGISFPKVRQGMDFFLVGFVVIMTLIFNLKWSLREGTIIGLLLFGTFLGIFMPRIEKLYEKLGIVDGKREIEKEIEGLE